MSRLVKSRKALQRQTLTMGKLVNGVTTQLQKSAKGNAQEKLRQAFVKRQSTVNLGGIYK